MPIRPWARTREAEPTVHLLAQGRSLSAAVLLAKAYVTAAISNAYPIGSGPGPVNHMYQMKNHPKAVGMVKKLASGKD